MTSDGFIIKFDGGDADGHALDMRLLGESLQGIERIASDLIVAVLNGRAPKKGERAPFVVKAYEPEAGTLTIPVAIQESATLLQLGWQVFGPGASNIISEWFKAVLLHYSGKKSESELALEAVVDLSKSQNSLLSQIETSRHTEVMGLQAILRTALEKLGPAAIQTVAPIGPSARRLWFLPSRKATTPQLEITEEDADLIRERDALEWTPLEKFVFQTDGYVFHNKRLSIVHPQKTGYFNAEVEDPIANIENNPYAVAGARKAMISVDAKLGYRTGSIERIVILNFDREIGRAA